MAYMPQRYSFGEYDAVPDWGFEFYPPPYSFAAPMHGFALPRAPAAEDCGCGGQCGHCGGHGLGIFDSMDFTTWGVAEWGTVALGVYLVGSLFSDTRGLGRRIRKASRRRRAIKRAMGE